MTNTERAKEWLERCIIKQYWDERDVALLTAEFAALERAVRLDEAEWWWEALIGSDEAKERIAQLRAAKEKK